MPLAGVMGDRVQVDKMKQCTKCMAYLDDQGDHILYLGTYLTPDRYLPHFVTPYLEGDAKAAEVMAEVLEYVETPEYKAEMRSIKNELF